MPKLYKAENIGGTIRTTIASIVELDFLCRDGSTSKRTIEIVYSLEMPMNLISIGELRFDGIIYNGFNDVIAIKSTGQEVAVFTWIRNILIFWMKDIKA